jgi:hypothetical protein|tara:strand:+ start:5631 stop:5783 length:153 start_codon:yes stop_codon:yes gene_type:complete
MFLFVSTLFFFVGIIVDVLCLINLTLILPLQMKQGKQRKAKREGELEDTL